MQFAEIIAKTSISEMNAAIKTFIKKFLLLASFIYRIINIITLTYLNIRNLLINPAFQKFMNEFAEILSRKHRFD